jgi:hypothetical protein
MSSNQVPILKDPKSLSVEISYCPCLGVYHYKRSDGVEYYWDNDKLEHTISVYIQQGKARDAEFQARLTTAARETPHKILIFRGDGTCEIKEPEVPEWVSRLGAEEKLGTKNE